MPLYSYEKPPYKWDPTIIKVIRGLAGVSTREMSAYLYMTEYDYERIETGEATPNLNDLIHIADYSGGSLDYLTGRAQDPESMHDKLRIAKTALYEQYLENGRLDQEYMKAEPAWPYNLFEAVLRDKIYEPLTDDQLEALDYILDKIDPREKDCILKYYKEEMSYREIGKAYNLSGSRIQQIVQDGIRRCARYENIGFLKYGKKGYEYRREINKLESKERYYTSALKQVKEKEEEYERTLERLRRIEHKIEEMRGRKVEPFNPLQYDPDMSIADLELSVRSYNCLKRAGIATLGELANKTYEDVAKIRNLGPGSFEEIVDKLMEMGVRLSSSKDAALQDEGSKDGDGATQ